MQFNYKYAGSSTATGNASSSSVSFAPDTLRQPTFFVGKLEMSLAFREAISALNAVVVSDLRFKPKDKTAYKTWLASQEEELLAAYMGEVIQADLVKARIESIRLRLSELAKQQNQVMEPFYKARRSYFDYLYKKDLDMWFVLDPVITVHPDCLFFECFSQDESTYGKLSCSYNVFKDINEFECGTTNIDYSDKLYNEFQKIRTYKETEFKVDPGGFEVQTGDEDVYKEVKIDLPDSWVRGFLQVSSAMTLPATTFEMHPMDIHSLCLYLRRFKEQHGPRSLRFVLEPGKPVRMILEPWNYEIVCLRSIYTGHQAQEVRLWGRRRLLALERLIPISKRFLVTLLGSGLPSFFEADMGDMVFTLGISGWTANDWSRAGNFDLLAPRTQADRFTQQAVFRALQESQFETVAALSKRLELSGDIVAGVLGAYTQAGRVIYDRYNGVYRLRELSREPLDMSQLRFSSPQEEVANRLLAQGGLRLETESREGGAVALHGSVKDRHREHFPFVVLDADERMVEARCDCNHYNMNQLRKGPCEHMLALRMEHGRRKGKSW